MELLFIFIIWSVLPMVIAYVLGKHKNRNWLGWILLSFFFGWVAVIILAVLPKKGYPVAY